MAVVAVLVCFGIYALGYVFYSRFLADKVFSLRPDAVTPAHAREDGVDYVPTHRFVLFGHHYASITGLSPMLGPAIAVIWGWLPAMAWVVLGGPAGGLRSRFRGPGRLSALEGDVDRGGGGGFDGTARRVAAARDHLLRHLARDGGVRLHRGPALRRRLPAVGDAIDRDPGPGDDDRLALPAAGREPVGLDRRGLRPDDGGR